MRTTLIEHETRRLALDEQQASSLARAGKALDLELLRPGEWRVTAKSHVGIVVGPRVELRIRPKCGTRSLLYLLGHAYGLARFQRERADQREIDDLREFLLEVLAGQLEALLRQGLRRAYVERDEELPALRGRLRVEAWIRRPLGTCLDLPVRHEEYTEDVRENQLLRFALERLAPARTPRLRARLIRCRRFLESVSRRAFDLRDFEAVRYDRLNEHYREPHALCRLLLEASGIETEEGAQPLQTFLVDMNVVFERFVAARLAHHLERGTTVRTQVSRPLDAAGRLRIRPDIVIDRGGAPVLVADTKYKLLAGPDSSLRPSKGDVYQVLAYCRALQLETGILIHVADRAVHERYPVVDGANVVESRAIRLDVGVREIEADLARLGRDLARLAWVAGRARAPVASRA